MYRTKITTEFETDEELFDVEAEIWFNADFEIADIDILTSPRDLSDVEITKLIFVIEETRQDKMQAEVDRWHNLTPKQREAERTC